MSTGVTNTVPYGLQVNGDERTAFAPARDRTASTRRVYSSHWSAWEKWSEDKGVAALPAESDAVAAYLSHRLTGGAKAPTVRTARAAISARHRDAGLDDPTTDARVKGLLSGSARASAWPQRQVTGITARELDPIKAMATIPRTGPSGRCESQAQAEIRGRVDIALILVMRDGVMGRSLAATVTWSNIQWAADGSGLLAIRHSQTDRTGRRVAAYLSRATMSALRAIQPENAHPGDPVFGLSPDQISRRIRAAASAAGLDGEFSSDSARFGMARDLAASGCELSALTSAPAARAAVSRYYGAAAGHPAQAYGPDLLIGVSESV